MGDRSTHTSGLAETRMIGSRAYVQALDDGWYRVQCPRCHWASMRTRAIDVIAQIAAAHRMQCGGAIRQRAVPDPGAGV